MAYRLDALGTEHAGELDHVQVIALVGFVLVRGTVQGRQVAVEGCSRKGGLSKLQRVGDILDGQVVVPRVGYSGDGAGVCRLHEEVWRAGEQSADVLLGDVVGLGGLALLRLLLLLLLVLLVVLLVVVLLLLLLCARLRLGRCYFCCHGCCCPYYCCWLGRRRGRGCRQACMGVGGTGRRAGPRRFGEFGVARRFGGDGGGDLRDHSAGARSGGGW